MSNTPPALLPIIDELARADSDAERALFCLAVSDEIVIGHWLAIIRILGPAGFSAGFDYILLRYAASTAVREPDGRFPDWSCERLEDLRRYLVAIVEGRR